MYMVRHPHTPGEFRSVHVQPEQLGPSLQVVADGHGSPPVQAALQVVGVVHGNCGLVPGSSARNSTDPINNPTTTRVAPKLRNKDLITISPKEKTYIGSTQRKSSIVLRKLPLTRNCCERSMNYPSFFFRFSIWRRRLRLASSF